MSDGTRTRDRPETTSETKVRVDQHVAPRDYAGDKKRGVRASVTRARRRRTTCAYPPPRRLSSSPPTTAPEGRWRAGRRARSCAMAKALVAYASKRGSTAEIAEAVAMTLREAKLSVDCVPVDQVGDLAPYDAVVLGSAVYMKRWRGDAKHFLRKHGKALASLPFWVFSSGPVGDPADDDPDWLEPPRILGQVEELGVRDQCRPRWHAARRGRRLHGEVDGLGHGAQVPRPARLGGDRAWAQRIANELDPQSRARRRPRGRSSAFSASGYWFRGRCGDRRAGRAPAALGRGASACPRLANARSRWPSI